MHLRVQQLVDISRKLQICRTLLNQFLRQRIKQRYPGQIAVLRNLHDAIRQYHIKAIRIAFFPYSSPRSTYSPIIYGHQNRVFFQWLQKFLKNFTESRDFLPMMCSDVQNIYPIHPICPGILGMDGDGKKDRPHFWRRSMCLFPNFLSQSNTYLNTVDKAGLLMVPAEGTDGIDNPVQFCQRYPIQKTVLFMESLFDLPVAPLQVFIAFIQERQNRLAISQFQRVGGNMVIQDGKVICIFHA